MAQIFGAVSAQPNVWFIFWLPTVQTKMGWMCCRQMLQKYQLGFGWVEVLKTSALARAPKFSNLWCCFCPTHLMIDVLLPTAQTKMGWMRCRQILKKFKLGLAWRRSFENSRLGALQSFPIFDAASAQTILWFGVHSGVFKSLQSYIMSFGQQWWVAGHTRQCPLNACVCSGLHVTCRRTFMLQQNFHTLSGG